MAGEGELRSLEQTPTWAVAVVCFILVLISIFIERLLHLLGKYLVNKNKRSLFESLEKVEAELMLLGFISLLLTVGQNLISNICVSKKIAGSWHPCSAPTKYPSNSPQSNYSSPPPPPPVGRKLLLETDGKPPLYYNQNLRRQLAGSGVDKCYEKGKVALVSTYAIHQLHIFIFVLAIGHVLYCIITMILGRLKMKKWKAWEIETRSAEYQFSHDPERFRFARETSFRRRHLNFWSKSPILIWIVCFFRQFVTSVSKVDYLTLRHGFIMAHLAPACSVDFNFLKYIKKSLEDDFQVVVGISPLTWLFAVLFLLFNTQGWYSYFWLPFIPLVILLLVGTKLQVIITNMALEIMEHDDVVKGVPVVQPDDKLFWFHNPKLLLNLINFILFENAFQLAFFIFSWYKFGLQSSFHEETEDIVIRVAMGVITQILCSYVTLPQYALVTQMGSKMKPVIFNDRVAKSLKYWHNTARRRVKDSRKSDSVTPNTSQPTTPTHGFSPVYLLKNHQKEIQIRSFDSFNNSPTYHTSRDSQDRFDAPEEGSGEGSQNRRKTRMKHGGSGKEESSR